MPTKGERAYQMRVRTECSWSVIGKSLHYSSRAAAWQSAKRWAAKHEKVWPPSQMLTFGKMCYEMAAIEGMTWKEIAFDLNRKHSSVVNAARGYCQYNGIHWPYWGRFKKNT